jgi:hypothetical protein
VQNKTRRPDWIIATVALLCGCATLSSMIRHIDTFWESKTTLVAKQLTEDRSLRHREGGVEGVEGKDGVISVAAERKSLSGSSLKTTTSLFVERKLSLTPLRGAEKPLHGDGLRKGTLRPLIFQLSHVLGSFSIRLTKGNCFAGRSPRWKRTFLL